MNKLHLISILIILIIGLSACTNDTIQPSGLESDDGISALVEPVSMETESILEPNDGEEQPKNIIYPYDSDMNDMSKYPLKDYEIPLGLLSTSMVDEAIFGAIEPVTISLYANDLYFWNGRLTPAQDASVFKLVTEIDGREYVLSWWWYGGTVEYRIYQMANSIPCIMFLHEHHSAGISITNYYYDIENQYFWSEMAYSIGDIEVGKGGVNTFNLYASEEEKNNLELPGY